MKRLLQTVALLVTAMLATQPALAAYAACETSSTRHACCHHLAIASNGAMAAIPAMPQSFAVGPECCPAQMTCGVREDSRQQSAVTVAKYSDAVTSEIAVGSIVEAPEITPRIAGATSGPAARYVLFRAFRI